MTTNIKSLLEKRIDKAIEQLNSLANEQAHRLNGADLSEVEIEDLQEVIDILEGKWDNGL